MITVLYQNGQQNVKYMSIKAKGKTLLIGEQEVGIFYNSYCKNV